MKIIYLDIDGVINALSRKPPRQNTQWMGEWGSKKVDGYPILWSKEFIAGLDTLIARDDVKLKWLTTWRQKASEMFAEEIGFTAGIGAEYFDSTELELEDFNSWWKLHRIQEDIEKENPEKAVWLDDDIRFFQPAVHWAIEEFPRLRSHSPFSSHGVSKSEFELIEEFLTVDPE